MMANYSRLKTLWLLVFIHLVCNANTILAEELEILEESETKDGKLDIVKQIKKVNDDGSYTFGYEAEDGTFKIESRDVLGNIKGTFGYIDNDGEIKRVSYSTSNTTEVTTTIVPPTEIPENLEGSSVVQKIPKANRTILHSSGLSLSTRRPPSLVFPSSTTASPPTSTGVIQTIPRRRPSAAPNTDRTTNDSRAASTTVRPSSLFYSTPAALRALQITTSKALKSTISPQAEVQKGEGGDQIIRPLQKDIVTLRPVTELPHLRRLVSSKSASNLLLNKQQDLSTIKPITEDSENPERERVRGNLLRRQLSQEKHNGQQQQFDPRQHLLSLQQSSGDDATDVYSGSVTTGTPRPPLFTTTARPISVVTAIPIRGNQPTTPRYPLTYQRNVQVQRIPQDNEVNTESTVNEASYTQNPYPVVQIPANKLEDGSGRPVQVLARHPYHQGTILVPLHQLRQQGLLPDNPHQPNQYSPPSFYPQIFIANEQQSPNVRHEAQATTTAMPEIQTVQSTPIPVQFITRTPLQQRFPVQIPVQHLQQNPGQYNTALPPIQIQRYQTLPQQVEELSNEINQITPPVSTRDFQKLIHQLVLRQNKLEQIAALTQTTEARASLGQQELYYPTTQATRFRPSPAFNPNQGQQHNQPIFLRRHPSQNPEQIISHGPNGPVTFVPAAQNTRQGRQQQQQQQQFIAQSRIGVQEHNHNQQHQQQEYESQYHTQSSFIPNRRVARLLSPRHQGADSPQQQIEANEDYLPPDVREMLLLKMLQLAINPALPLETPDAADKMAAESVQVTTQRIPVSSRRIGTRNVEILGEEIDEIMDNQMKRSNRNKRYRDSASDYY